MSRTVRVGTRYVYVGNLVQSMFACHIRPGTEVTVINLPGGSRGGIFRNVQDDAGNIHLVHIGCLAPARTYNKYLGSF